MNRAGKGKGGAMPYIDPVEASPNNYKVVLDNDHVRVLQMDLKAGQTDVTHSHPSETVYFVRGGKVRYIFLTEIA